MWGGVWRMWRVMAEILIRFSAQEHGTDTKIPDSAELWILHLQNTVQCNCIWYNLVLFAVFFSLTFWVSHLINQNHANTFCVIGKYILFCKTFKLAPPKRANCSTYQLRSQCCPLCPAIHYTAAVLILRSFVSIYMNEPGTVMDCLLWNVAVLLTVECNTVI